MGLGITPTASGEKMTSQFVVMVVVSRVKLVVMVAVSRVKPMNCDEQQSAKQVIKKLERSSVFLLIIIRPIFSIFGSPRYCLKYNIIFTPM